MSIGFSLCLHFRRGMGTRPLHKGGMKRALRRSTTRAFKKPQWTPTVNNEGIVKLMGRPDFLKSVQSKIVESGAIAQKHQRLMYFVGSRKLLSIPVPIKWFSPLIAEKALMDRLNNPRSNEPAEMNAAKAVEMTRISGKAMELVPGGIAVVYGCKKDIENALSKIESFPKNRKGIQSSCFAFPMKLGFTDNGTVLSLRDLKNSLVSVAEKLPGFRKDLLYQKRFGDGVYRISSALNAVEFSSITAEHHLLVLVEATNKKRETLSITLPGGKRQIFEVSHKAAERALSDEVGGLGLEIKHDDPCFFHKGNSDRKVLMFVKSIGEIEPLTLKEDALAVSKEYVKNFEEMKAWFDIPPLERLKTLQAERKKEIAEYNKTSTPARKFKPKGFVPVPKQSVRNQT